MALTDDFEQAQTDAKSLPARPSNDVLLRLYALYKQGTQGDATGSRPGLFDPVGRAKYDAWKSVAGTSQEDAQRDYVTLVNSLRS
ncbi:acyl-CoA-binding protein [Dactylosporangium sucinum]|uniref:Acyl-CoA-binding protein n=1 Tax=Dactylosporangium sucinum TaxID=1424081 RepID=A0A917T1Y9_9ACTN|nr:acyl-CoA-binding protein [Dactylosporangium sucinum]GGM06536.1 acyl-CoA-binding protein [Dactylosporangium sucinum]